MVKNIHRQVKKRNSSVEVYRIIATFLVLVVHFNGWFVGGMPERLSTFDFFHISHALIESLSCTCVNCFLVITGWYGVKFKWKHVWTIWSILVCIYVPCYLVTVVYTGTFSIKTLIMDIIALTKESYYVQCYLMILFLSPILNAFINKYNRRILPYSLVFWCIEIVFDWILHNRCLGFGYGYMLTHFVFMYILGQTAYMYRDELTKYMIGSRCICVYMVGTLVLTLFYIILPADKTFAYTNPVNVVMAFALFLIFERKIFYNKLINWFGKSTLAVYILHCTSPVINILQKWDVYALHNYSYLVYLGLMSLTIIVVFIIGILYDKIRILFMPAVGNIVCNWISAKTSKYSLEKYG